MINSWLMSVVLGNLGTRARLMEDMPPIEGGHAPAPLQVSFVEMLHLGTATDIIHVATYDEIYIPEYAISSDIYLSCSGVC